MSKLLKNILNWFRIGAKRAGEATTCPITDGELAIDDHKQKLAEFRASITDALAQQKKQSRDLKEIEAEAAQFLTVAKAAKNASTEDGDKESQDAKSALAQYNKLTAKAETRQETVRELEKFVNEKREELARYEERIEDSEDKLEQGKVRKKSADIRKSMAGGTNLASLDQFEDDLQQAEAAADAAEEMSSSPQDDLLEKYGTKPTAKNAVSFDDL